MLRKAALYSVIYFILGIGVACNCIAATSYYVSPNGSDSNNGLYPNEETWRNGPFKTLTRAVPILSAGDTLYLRSGIYYETVHVDNSGTENAPITIDSFLGEKAVIDGQHKLPGNDWGVLFHMAGNYLVLRNIDIKSSQWLGLVVSGHHSQAINVSSYDHMENGILLRGDFTSAAGCRVWFNARSNENSRRLRYYWSSGLSAARHPRHAAIRNCTVWNNWGEGLSTFEAEYTIIEDNIVYDNQTNIYVSDAKHCLVQRNLVYSTPGNSFSVTVGRQVGIMMGDEKYTPPSSDNLIINNFLVGNQHNFYWWQGSLGGGLVNSTIAYNTLVNSAATTNFQVSDGSHSNSQIRNNIILQEDRLPIAIIGSTAGLLFSNNLWSKKPPMLASGAGDVIGNPMLFKAAPVMPGQLSPGYFKILGNSPSRAAAISMNAITDDFFRNQRGVRPDIGGHEYQIRE